MVSIKNLLRIFVVVVVVFTLFALTTFVQHVCLSLEKEEEEEDKRE